MGILPVNLNLRHPKVGSDSEVGSRPAHRSLFWALGGAPNERIKSRKEAV
jgi:hypothetical protein